MHRLLKNIRYPKKNYRQRIEIFITIIVVLLFIACNNTFNDIKKYKVKRPEISYFSPKNGAVDVATNTAVLVAFNKEISPFSVNSDLIKLQGSQGNLITGSLEQYGANVILFKPANRTLAQNEIYTMILDEKIADISGQCLGKSFSFYFTTGLSADVSSPTVVATYPLNKGSLFIDDEIIFADFSEDIDPFSVSEQNVVLYDAYDSLVPGTVSYVAEKKRIVFTPQIPLQRDSMFKVELLAGNNGIMDLSGVYLESTYSWYFFTTPDINSVSPYIISTSPYKNSYITTDWNKEIKITFNKEIDAASIHPENIFLSDQSKQIDITHTQYDPSTLTATYFSDIELQKNTTYTVTVKKQGQHIIYDTQGLTLEKDNVFEFYTNDSDDFLKPTVVNVSPAHNEKLSASWDKKIHITFDKRIDVSTITNNMLYLSDGTGAKTIINTSYNEETKTITATVDLDIKANTVYAAKIYASGDTSVRDVFGLSLEQDFDWGFYTDNSDEYKAPYILQILPNPQVYRGFVGGAWNKQFSVTLNKAINCSTVSIANLKFLEGVSPVPVISAECDPSSTIITYKVDMTLVPDKTYYIQMETSGDNALKDILGNSLSTLNAQWTYTTQGWVELNQTTTINNYIGKLHTDDRTVVDSSGLMITSFSAFMLDPNNSGEFADNKIMRMIIDGQNIASMGWLPVYNDFSTGYYSPSTLQVFVNSNNGTFMLPRPDYWSKFDTGHPSAIDSVRIPQLAYCSETANCNTLISYVEGGSGVYNLTNDPDAQLGNAALKLEEASGVGGRWFKFRLLNKGSNAGTISFWAKLVHNMGPDSSGASIEFTLPGVTNYTEYSDYLYINFATSQLWGTATTLAQAKIKSSNISVYDSSASITHGVYNHFFIVWDSSKNLTGGNSLLVFVNGIQKLASNVELPDLAASGYSYGMYIGANNYGTAYIDNLKIWSHAVTDNATIISQMASIEDAMHAVYGNSKGFKLDANSANDYAGYNYYIAP